MDRPSAIPGVLDRPASEVMEPPMPMVGIGETVTDVVEALDRGPVGAACSTAGIPSACSLVRTCCRSWAPATRDGRR